PGIVVLAPAATRTLRRRGFCNLRTARRLACSTLFRLGRGAGGAADHDIGGPGFMRARVHTAKKMARNRLRRHRRDLLCLSVSRHGNPQPYGSPDREARGGTFERRTRNSFALGARGFASPIHPAYGGPRMHRKMLQL